MKYLMKSTLNSGNMNCCRNNNNNSFEKKVKLGLEDFKNNKHFLNDAVLSVRITKNKKYTCGCECFPKAPDGFATENRVD